MLGYAAAEVIGIASPAIIHDEYEVVAHAKKLTKELNRLVEPGVDVFHIKVKLGLVDTDVNEWTYIRKNGSRITVELSLATLRDKSNNITGYLGIAKDITERKKAEIEIIKAKEAAEAASRAKSDFLANMSHEIRTPLNGVIGFTDLLMDTELDKEQNQYMAIVNQSAHSLLDIVDDILDFSKIEAGKLELYIKETNLRQMVSQVADTVRFQVDKKKLDMRLTVADDVPHFVWADEIRVKQVLINLLSNAVKFTPSGEIELKVEKIQTDLQSPTAKQPFRFSVRDTGIGISPKNHAKVFQEFAQEDSTTTKKYGGTGLGLTISNRLLAMMDSQLQLQSDLGNGSFFYFDLSLDPIQSEPALPVGMQPSTEAVIENFLPTLPSGMGLKILIVEDNGLNMTLVKIIIKQILPEVVLIEATDGKKAIEQFVKELPHLIFMDVQMPEMNGCDAATEIRKVEACQSAEPKQLLTKRVPIIALTAGIVQGEREKCFQAGMDDYVSKPIVDDSIRKMITKWIFNL
jgi:signal transduction histidine kinase/CheY-like chemotaxis protein